MPVIEAKNLTKQFGKGQICALCDISFALKTGEITGLVGPDGAGKTTLIRLMSGLLKYERGELVVLNTKMPDTESSFLENIGYMPQKFGLYEDLSVDENLEFYASLQNIKDTKERIDFLLDFIKLEHFRSRKVGDLSGGMKQKLALAVAIIKKPKILLLDEPSIGVDPISRRDLWDMTNSIKDDIAVVWATSNLDEAQNCDNVILLDNGKMLYCGSPKKIMKKLENRVLKIEGEFANAKETTEYILKNDALLDAVFLGSHIKIILKKGAVFPQDIVQQLGKNIKISNIKPNFEDAFLDILHIKTEVNSALSAILEEKEKNEIVISVTALGKKFGDFVAAENINFTLKSGEIFGLLGPNGAGKSTVFKMLCSLLKQSSGDISILGSSFKHAEIRKHIGYVAQKFSLYGSLKLIDNLDFFANLYEVKNAEQKIREMIDIFDFQKYMDINAADLPLGIKQRLALSCALIHDPKILFLDEPTSGVDTIVRKEFWTHINAIANKGAAVMVTTHFMNEAEYCDRIMLVNNGRTVDVGTPNELKRKVSKNASMEDVFIHLIGRHNKEFA